MFIHIHIELYNFEMYKVKIFCAILGYSFHFHSFLYHGPLCRRGSQSVVSRPVSLASPETLAEIWILVPSPHLPSRLLNQKLCVFPCNLFHQALEMHVNFVEILQSEFTSKKAVPAMSPFHLSPLHFVNKHLWLHPPWIFIKW